MLASRFDFLLEKGLCSPYANKYKRLLVELGGLIKEAPMTEVRRILDTIFKDKEIELRTVPITYYRVKFQGRILIISHKRAADNAEFVAGELALGYEK
jgi:hypothetical protein